VAELALILTDLFAATVGTPAVIERIGLDAAESKGSAAGSVGGKAHDTGSPPRLFALETVLARATLEPLNDWRAWLANRVSIPRRSGLAAAAAEAFRERLRAKNGEPRSGAHYWFATPLHLFAGIDSVHLHPAGLLQLDEPEQQRLADDFTRVFAGTPWSLNAIGQRELLLAGPALGASAADPAVLITGTAETSMARGPDAAALRRLGSEIELWLHDHPLNLERGRRGELAVTALWLWGGVLQPDAPSDALHPPDPIAHLPSIYGRDSYAAALCKLGGESARALPSSFSAEPALIDARRDSVVLLPMLSERGFIASLVDLERLWLADALAAVRSRRLATLYCLLGARAYRLTWRHCIRVWRRRAPWWEELS
jgi:hypothetical protein